MKEFKDKVSVITGAASGIGFGIAEKCAREGMKIVLADIEINALNNAEAKLKEIGVETLAVLTDVSKGKEIKALADITYNTFGEANLLFNNAGVGITGSLWEHTEADWEWVLSVNLLGVINGIRVFVPRMLEQDGYGHIINTASVAGILSYPFMGVYSASKHGVVTISEILHHELRLLGSELRVSVLCPGLVKTNIMEAERNRPESLVNTIEDTANKEAIRFENELRSGVESGMSVEALTDIVFNAIRNEKFYILTHPQIKEIFQRRFHEILK